MLPAVGPLLVAVVPLLVAGVLRGVTGFGMLLVATPLLFQVYDPKLVIAALAVPGLLTNLVILYRDGVPWDELATHWALYLTGAVGAVLGVVGLVVLDRGAIFLIVAAYIVVYLVFEHVGDLTRSVAATRGMSVFAGGSAGLLGGTVGLAGPPVVTYLHAKPFGKRAFVTLLAVFFLMLALVRVPSMYVADLFGPLELALGVAFTLPAVVGVYLGTLLRPLVPQDRFELLVEAFLLLVAVKLVLDGLSVSVF